MSLPRLEDVQAELDASPYNQWLGLRITELTTTTATFEATARDEWVSSPERQAVHGGVVSALLDTAADFALIGTIGSPVPTIDLTVHYLRPVTAGTLTVKGRVLKPGRQIATADAELFDADGKLLATARGTFLASAAAPLGGQR